MSLEDAMRLLKEATRGIKHRPWEVLNASITVNKERAYVKCPECGVGDIRKFQADQGQSCYLCITKK